MSDETASARRDCRPGRRTARLPHAGPHQDGGPAGDRRRVSRVTRPSRASRTCVRRSPDKFRTENASRRHAEQVVVSCGGKHSLFNIIHCVVRPGDEVHHPLAALVLLRRASEVRRRRGPWSCQTREEDGFQPDVAAIRAAVTDRTRALILNSPCNPTGAVYGRSTLRATWPNWPWSGTCSSFPTRCTRRSSSTAPSTCRSPASGPEIAARTATVGSVSKTHSMTGWRIGYAVMPLELAAVGDHAAIAQHVGAERDRPACGTGGLHARRRRTWRRCSPSTRGGGDSCWTASARIAGLDLRATAGDVLLASSTSPRGSAERLAGRTDRATARISPTSSWPRPACG